MAELNIEKFAKKLAEKALAEEYRGKKIREWIDEIVRRTTPHPVIFECTGYADGAPVYDKAFCPVCDHVFEDGYDDAWGDPYCSHCGTALDWKIPEEGDS